VPYDTKGRKAARRPRLIARAGNPGGAIVTPPVSVLRSK
jgi:hypothetical protein